MGNHITGYGRNDKKADRLFPVSESRSPGHDAQPSGYDVTQYPRFSVTVDVVILTVVDRRLHVLLIERRDPPFAGAWALPGGFKLPTETLDDAAARELGEETGVDVAGHLSQFQSYGDPGRDPRDNVVTVAYLAVVADVGPIRAGDEAVVARLVPVEDVLSGDLAMAFDHCRIVNDAVAAAAERLENSALATAFLGPSFTLSQLQGVYEAVWGDDLDAANFRRSLALSSSDADYVRPTGERASAGHRGGRPAELFEAGSSWADGAPPVRRSRRKRPKKNQ